MNIKKTVLILIGILITIILLLIAVNWQNNPGNDLEIIFLNVGQGDAILIKTPDDQQILVDGGPDKRVINELSNNMPFYDHDLDLVILTHPHADHVAGLVEVLKRYEVKKVMHTGVLHTAPDYLAFLEIIKEKNIENEIVKAKKDVMMGSDVKLEFLYPFHDLSGTRPDNLNNTSIVFRLVYKDFKTILTGDAEIEVEKEIIKAGFNLESQVLKAGHHGSNTASSDDFLDLLKPETAIIQCGLDNDFGHPHLRTLKKFRLRDMEVYRNDISGQISLFSDGSSYQVFAK